MEALPLPQQPLHPGDTGPPTFVFCQPRVLPMVSGALIALEALEQKDDQ